MTIFKHIFKHILINYKEPIRVIKDLSEFLGVSLSDNQVQALVEFTLFDNMKGYKSFDFGSLGMPSDENLKKMKFFRKGQIGNWREHLSEKMSSEIDEMVRDKLEYKRPFKYVPSISK